MSKKLEHLYYRSYRFQVPVGNGTIAELNAVIQLSFTVMLNIFTLIFFLYGLCRIKLLDVNPTVFALSLSLGLMLVGHLLFIYNGRYKSIIETYKKEISSDREGNIFVWVYFIGSVVLFILSIFSIAARNNGLF